MKKTVSLILTLAFVLQALLLLTSCEINVTFPDIEHKTEQARENDSDIKDGIGADTNDGMESDPTPRRAWQIARNTARCPRI